MGAATRLQTGEKSCRIRLRARVPSERASRTNKQYPKKLTELHKCEMKISGVHLPWDGHGSLSLSRLAHLALARTRSVPPSVRLSGIGGETLTRTERTFCSSSSSSSFDPRRPRPRRTGTGWLVGRGARASKQRLAFVPSTLRLATLPSVPLGVSRET